MEEAAGVVVELVAGASAAGVVGAVAAGVLDGVAAGFAAAASGPEVVAAGAGVAGAGAGAGVGAGETVAVGAAGAGAASPMVIFSALPSTSTSETRFQDAIASSVTKLEFITRFTSSSVNPGIRCSGIDPRKNVLGLNIQRSPSFSNFPWDWSTTGRE